MSTDVIIPVYNQKESLALTLKGFQNQTVKDFQVLIVDDGSRENITAFLPFFDDLDITYIYQKNKGRARARNFALQIGSGENIIFCDADRIPASDFVEKHVVKLNYDENIICIGKIKEVYFSEPWKERARILNIVQSNSKMAKEPLHSKNVDYLYDEKGQCLSKLPWISTYSGNMSIKRKTLEKVGGFDEEFTDWGFEHFELGYRLFLKGVKFVRDRGAINYHIAHKREKNFYFNAITKSHALFYKKHPTKEILLLKDYMMGNLSLQAFEIAVSGEILWDHDDIKSLFMRL